MMEEQRQRKVDMGKTMFDEYMRKKNSDHGRTDCYSTPEESTFEASVMPPVKSVHETEKGVRKMDLASLHKKTAQFESLNKQIKYLQNELSEKSEHISVLEIQNKVLREGKGDGVENSLRDGDKEMIKELKKMVDARDTYIEQLSGSLQKRSEELEASLQREKDVNKEIQSLRQQMNTLAKETEMKLSESYSDSVEYKAKVELMSNQIQEYSELVQSLRNTMEMNSKELITKKEELAAKEKKLEKYKSEVSEDIKQLMKQVETLNVQVSLKEQELNRSKKEVEMMRSHLEEQFGADIVALKTKLENKYAEDIKKVEVLYDGMLLEHIRKSDDQLKVVKECSNLEDEIKCLKDSYECEINKYKEELQTLVEKSKATEEKLTSELEKYKREADHYRQQIDKLESKVSEDVKKIQDECFKELDKFDAEMKKEKIKYEEEVRKLSNKLKENAVAEAKMEVEVETYKHEFVKLQHHLMTVEMQKSQILNELNEYKQFRAQREAELAEYRKSESELMEELSSSRAKVCEYENKIHEFRESVKRESSKFSEQYQDVVGTFQEQIQKLMFELERNKAFYEEEISRNKSVINEQENQIKNFEAKLNYILTIKNTKDNSMSVETSTDHDSVQEQLGQINMLTTNLKLSENLRRSNTEFLFSILSGLKEVKTFVNQILNPGAEDSLESGDACQSESNVENTDQDTVTKELAKTINELVTITQSVDPKNVTVQSRFSNMFTSTPRANNHDQFSDPLCIRGDPGNDWAKKCELLEAENIKLTRKLEVLIASIKEMEYCLYVATKESTLFDKKCKDLDSKITELETLKMSEFMLKKENNELKERLAFVEESELKIRQELAELVENNMKLEKLLNKGLVDIHDQLSNNTPNIDLEVVLTDLKAKSEEVVRLRSQLSSVQKALKENQVKTLQMKAQCDKFIADHEFMMSEIKTKQKELEDIWKERNELSTENKMLQSKLLSVQAKSSSWEVHKVPSAIKSSSTFAGEIDGFVFEKESENQLMSVSEKTEDSQLKRLQTLQLLTESIGLSSKTNLRITPSNYSVSDRIDLELQELDQLLEEPVSYHMPTIREEDEENMEEDRRFFEQLAQGDQPSESKDDGCTPDQCARKILVPSHYRIALRRLLSFLFIEYTSHVKKMLLPWIEECQTLDLNLQKDLDLITRKTRSNGEQSVEIHESVDNSIDLKESSAGNTSSEEFLKILIEHCIRSLIFLKKRLINAHNAVLKTVKIHKYQLEKSCQILELQEHIRRLELEKNELEKKHKSAMELLIKDHETELSMAKNLLAKLQNNNSVIVTEDSEGVRRELEQKHRKEVEELRTYFEKKCADLEKHYSEEIYSQSQQNSKVSMSSCSSDVANIVDLYEDEQANQMESEESLHRGCEKRICELKELLENMQEKYKGELDSAKSECELRLSESVCKMCRKTLNNGEEPRAKQSGITLEQYYTEKIKELGDKYSSANVSKDLELKVYQIKEEVRKDYEVELDKIREEIVEKELKRKDEEIKIIKAQLDESHKVEIEKLWRRYEELANKEVENSIIRVKNEVILTQELEEKGKLVEQLKHDKKELLRKQSIMNEQKSRDIELTKSDLQRAHKKEIENIKQAFEIELTTRIDTVMEEKSEMEAKYKKQIEKLQGDVRKLHSEKGELQQNEQQELQNLAEEIRKEILRALELQIKAMVESGDEGEDKSSWPPELVALERQFTNKYQQQLAQLVEEHALEIADIRAEYEAKLGDLVREYSIKEAEEMPVAIKTTGDDELDKVIRERDNLRSLALTLRRVVQELAVYLTTCEDELNKSIVGELLKLASPHKGNKVQIYPVDSDSSESEGECLVVPQKKVHFAPDVSHIVSLMDESLLFDNNVDLSVHFHTELESCLERLRDEAAALLGLSQGREAVMPSTVEDRRLTSLTRQLIEEKKAKEEANNQLKELQELIYKYEKELNEVHKELTETKDRMIKEKVAAETEFSERQSDQRVRKLCHLQEKARTLLTEKGDCPPVWLALIEELCTEGDALLEEAWRERDELKSEVEAADKQLRSTRAFLEEQALDREQERDEFGKEIERLNALLRERDRDWTSQRQFATECPPSQLENDAATDHCHCAVEALELQVKETTELLKDTELKKVKFEKEYKAAVEKIWTLREIISELETQVNAHGEREATLERRLVEVQSELLVQTQGHTDVLQELQSLRDSGEEQRPQQEEQTCRQANAKVIRQIKSQLRTMAKSMEHQIKELEAVNIHVSNASLSSPSEDISIREQLEALRCLTPEAHGSPSAASPTCPPLEEFDLLSERLLRYSRAAENVIKKLRDRDMQIELLRGQNEELQTERDVLQGQNERQLLQVASLTNKVEELRVRNDREIQAATQPLMQRVLQLEKEVSELNDQLRDSQRTLGIMKQKLERSESLVQSQDSKIRNLSDHQYELVEKLTQDLETMRAEKQQLQVMVEKYRTEESVSFPQLIEVMLAEKNADIDQLQQRVEELLVQQDQSSSKNQSSKSRGLRVSFADSVAHSRLEEGEKARDIYHDYSSIRPIFSTPFSSTEDGGSKPSLRVIGGDLSKIPEPVEIVNEKTVSPNRAVQLESVLSQLKSELEQKSQRLLECEAQLQELPLIEEELKQTKEQLQALGEVKQQLAEKEKELVEVKEELAEKEEDNVRTAADVKALQVIMEGMQQKLKEAKTFAEFYENNPVMDELREANNKYKEECDVYKNTVTNLEEQLAKVRQALENEKAAQENLQKTVVKLETDKQNILSDLIMTKSKCKSLQEELEAALSSAKENSENIESLRMQLEDSQKEKNTITVNYQRLKKDMDRLSKKQQAEVKNMLRKDSEEAVRMKEELESLKSSNSELQSENEKLQQKLNDVGNSLGSLCDEINTKDDKLQQLKNELQELEENYKTLKSEKVSTEQSLNKEIAVLKILRDDLNRNLVSLETDLKEPQGSEHEKDNVAVLRRKYETLKREYERQRRARRESEKKYSVLKDELLKEKQFSSNLTKTVDEKRVPRLEITKANLIDIRDDGATLTSSLDDLTDEVQKQLNTSARLDQTLISELQHKTEAESVQAGRSEVMPPRTDYLSVRLAEVETALRVERVVVSELRARLAEERGRYLEQRQMVTELREELSSLQTLNDQLEDKFRGIALHLEQQVNGVKDLMKTEPVDSSSKERELKRLLEENQRRVDELMQERVFNKNQLLYLREELAKMKAEQDNRLVEVQGHGHGDSPRGTAVENMQRALESRSYELEQEQGRSAMLQRMLEQANRNTEQQARELQDATARAGVLQDRINELQKQLDFEVELRKSLESKIKAMELAERSRHTRRRASEEKLKEQIAEAEKAKKQLERECMGLQLRLKQSQLQIKAHTEESPLALRLTEANITVERLVGEKEDLLSAITILREEREELLKRRREQDEVIEDLKCRIHALNIKVTDGGVDNLNAMFAAERAAWLKEKEALKKALSRAQTQVSSGTDSFNRYPNSAHILQKYLRAESHRKALVWQKRYLLVSLRGYQEEEKQTVAALYRFPAPSPPPPPTAEQRFRVAVCTVRAVFRMQFLVDHRKRAHENTCRLLQRALNSARSGPYNAENLPELQTLWQRNNAGSSRQPLQPGSIAQYVERFNTLQDSIKNALSTSS